MKFSPSKGLAGLTAIVAAALLTGCPTNDEIALGQTTSAPATKTAYLNNNEDDNGYYLNLSPGVAIGVRCWDTCSNTCADVTITSGNASVLTILDADQALRSPNYVFVAHAPGVTEVNVSNACASRTYEVTVE